MAKPKPTPKPADADAYPVEGLAVTDPGAGDENPAPAPAPAAGDRVAALEATVARLEALLSSAAAAGTVAPAGYKLVRDEPTQDAKSLAEQAAIRAEIEKGNRARTQEAADRMWQDGKHRYRCSLPDKNGHPEVVVTAGHPTDAAARYLAAIGVNSTEHKVQVARA